MAVSPRLPRFMDYLAFFTFTTLLQLFAVNVLLLSLAAAVAFLPPAALAIYGLLLFAPLAAFLRPARPTAAAAGLMLLAATLTAIVEALSGSGAIVQLGEWIAMLGISIEWCFAFDGLAAAMFVPIVGVSLLVQLYSIGYMGADPSFARFMGYLAFFTFAMILLVVADNMLLLFLGWEAVGVASYLLINFWFTRAAANLAALKAFLLNRIGDLFLAWAAILALAAIGDASYGVILPLVPFLSEQTIGLIAVLLVGAASAKSALAVLGIHVWLPAAMEGPTPVSALIHAATMVTAGIYLFCRFGPLLEWCSTALLLIVALGAIGALGGSVAGLLEADIKRVIAYSTVSQLGYMAVAAGASHHSLALFHLANHAFFKALLFLTAGAIIHAVADEQDMRRMGGLVLVLPAFYTAALLGSLSLMAFPFLTGFYSKDLLLELAAVPFNVTLTVAYGLLFAAALFTALYSVRLLAVAFLQGPSFSAALADGGDEGADRLITLPLLALAIGAALFGFVAAPLFRESALIGEAFAALPHHAVAAIGEPAGALQKLPLILLLVPLTALPAAMGRTMRASGRVLRNPLAAWNELNGHAIAGGQAAALLASRYFDRGLLELAGPLGLVRLFHFLSFKLELAATGYAAHYALLFLGISAALVGLYA